MVSFALAARRDSVSHEERQQVAGRPERAAAHSEPPTEYLPGQEAEEILSGPLNMSVA